MKSALHHALVVTSMLTVATWSAEPVHAAPAMDQAATVVAAKTLSVDVVASGDKFGAYPKMALRVNGKQVAVLDVTTEKNNWKTYHFDAPLPSGWLNTVSVAFMNDYYEASGKDRNLYVQSVAINGVKFTPEQGVIYTGNGQTIKGNGNFYSYAELAWNVSASKEVIATLSKTNGSAATSSTSTSPTTSSNPPATTPPITAASKVLYDNQGYASGSYMAYVAPWGKGSLVKDKDYKEKITLYPSTFPNNVTIDWSWPNVAAKTGVYNFNGIDFGNYSGTVVPKPIPSKQVKDIKTLKEKHHFTLSGELKNFNVIDDFFLRPKAGDNNVRLFEIEVFLHTSASGAWYVNHVTQLGTVTISGVTWKVAIDKNAVGPDILFMPVNGQDVSNQEVDLKAMLDYLVSTKVITGNEWFNGMGIGSETVQGSGAVTFVGLEATYN